MVQWIKYLQIKCDSPNKKLSDCGSLHYPSIRERERGGRILKTNWLARIVE